MFKTSFFNIPYSAFSMLSDQDSNLDRQNQNLQCYRYTIGQTHIIVPTTGAQR